MTEIVSISDAREKREALLREHSSTEKFAALMEENMVDRLTALLNAAEDVKVTVNESLYRCPKHGSVHRKPGRCPVATCGAELQSYLYGSFAALHEVIGDVSMVPAREQARLLVDYAIGKLKIEVTCEECLNRNSRCQCEDRS
jgi:hypothetical protein